MQHADHFGTFFINGHGIEVGNLNERIRLYRMRHRPAVFGKLHGAHDVGVFNPFNRGGMHIGRKAGIAEHRKAFFQAELEPVTAGHAIARPVVEIFVRHNGFNALISRIGGGGRISQHTGRIKNIQALIFHGAHVEIIHRHDHKNIQIVFAPIHFFVPAHGTFQRIQSVLGFVDIARLNKNLQSHVATTHGGELIFLNQ